LGGRFTFRSNLSTIFPYYLQEVRMENVLKVAGLKKFYGGLEALKH
jgi:hypothetical protein